MLPSLLPFEPGSRFVTRGGPASFLGPAPGEGTAVPSTELAPGLARARTSPACPQGRCALGPAGPTWHPASPWGLGSPTSDTTWCEARGRLPGPRRGSSSPCPARDPSAAAALTGLTQARAPGTPGHVAAGAPGQRALVSWLPPWSPAAWASSVMAPLAAMAKAAFSWKLVFVPGPSPSPRSGGSCVAAPSKGEERPGGAGGAGGTGPTARRPRRPSSAAPTGGPPFLCWAVDARRRVSVPNRPSLLCHLSLPVPAS